ncbi:MAG: hypothetical protein SCJ93_04890, partial [Bacillota bacterium]|nr:hypothetical protein [Bacillota bacterium]
KLSITNIESLNIELLRKKIYTDDGILSYSDKTIKITDYDCKTKWSLEIEDFISEVYFYDNIYIVTENKNKIIEIDKNGNNLSQYDFESEVIHVDKGKDIFVILKLDKEINKAVKIIDGNKEELSINGNIVFLSPKDKIDSYFIGYFYFNNGKINSIIQQRLIKDDIKRWETILEGELLVDVKQTSSRNFVLTQKNFYTFNTDGIILWKYNNFDTVKEFTINEDSNEILILDNKKLHIINFDSSVENVVQLDQSYDRIKTYNNTILLSNSNSITVIGEEKYSIWPIDEKIINYHLMGNIIYIETDFNFYRGIIK